MKYKLIAAVLICAVCLFGQQAPTEPSPSFFQKLASPWSSDQIAPAFPTPGYFRKTFSTPSNHVELQPPSKLADYVQDGKLVLSLRAYLDLVMANNTDIAVQKLSIETSRNNVIGSFSRFDPTLSLNASHGRTARTSTDKFDAVSQIKSLSQSSDISYSQVLPTGQNVSAGLSWSKGTSTSANNALGNPNFGAGMNFSISQPLLRGRSLDIVRMNITTARLSLRTTEFNLQNSLMSSVQSAEMAYWDLVMGRENLRVQQESLKLQKESLDRSEKELELGAMAPLDISRPRATYATAQLRFSQAQFNLRRTEDALRRQMGADLDPNFRTMPIELTEKIEPPSNATEYDAEALIQKALSNRPDLQASRLGLERDDLTIKQTLNSIRPDLNFTTRYSTSGAAGGPFVGLFSPFDPVFGRDNPSYTFSLRLSLPLHDRQNHVALANNMIQKKSDLLNLRSREQSVRLEILNAVNSVESSRKSIELAIVSRDLAQQQLDNEWKKYNLGTQIMFYVLDAQNNLTTAENQLATEYINYHRNVLTLKRATGELLSDYSIVVQ